MAIPDFWQVKSNAFFSRIEALESVYKEVTIAFVAVRKDDQFVVVNGLMRVINGKSDFRFLTFESENVLAGNFRLSEIGLSPRAFFNAISNGVVNTPFGELLFPDNDGNGHAYYYEELHPTGRALDQRTEMLRLAGPDLLRYLQFPEIDWQLKAADQPYDCFGELVEACGLGDIPSRVQFEFVTFNVALLAEESVISDGFIIPNLIIAEGLEKEKVKIGFRTVVDGHVTDRGNVKGAGLRWGIGDQSNTATFELPLPHGARIQCIISYDGIAQHFVWLSDPTITSNNRRLVYEAFDPNLSALRDLSGNFVRSGNGSHDFEAAFSWLMWMLGFNPCFLGEVSRLKQGPDTLAMTPSGNMIIVECTTGRLDDKDKLSKLIDRTVQVKKLFAGTSNRRVLPLIVTTKPRDEVAADLKRAAELGAAVLCSDDLLSWIEKASAWIDADALFFELEENVATSMQEASTIDGGQWQ